MTDEDLAGQVLMPYAYGSSATTVDAAAAAGNRRLAGVDTPAAMVATYHLGGLILVGFSAADPTTATNATTNVEDPRQVRALTDGLQVAARQLHGAAPLLIGTDQEYGVVTRVAHGVTLLPSAMGAGAAARPELTEAAWHAAGEELAAMGITVDFAPVADTLGSAQNTVIGSRSFGGDATANAAQVAAAVRGLQGAGVAAGLKHFPGHGHTTGDSHDELPVVAQSPAAWTGQDLPPFAAGVTAGAGVVMSGHLDVQALDRGVPATFSHKIMTDVLRGQLGFTGVAITDAMNMAPAMTRPPGEAAVRALNAGNDMLLMPPDIGKAPGRHPRCPARRHAVPLPPGGGGHPDPDVEVPHRPASAAGPVHGELGRASGRGRRPGQVVDHPAARPLHRATGRRPGHRHGTRPPGYRPEEPDRGAAGGRRTGAGRGRRGGPPRRVRGQARRPRSARECDRHDGHPVPAGAGAVGNAAGRVLVQPGLADRPGRRARR